MVLINLRYIIFISNVFVYVEMCTSMSLNSWVWWKHLWWRCVYTMFLSYAIFNNWIRSVRRVIISSCSQTIYSVINTVNWPFKFLIYLIYVRQFVIHTNLFWLPYLHFILHNLFNKAFTFKYTNIISVIHNSIRFKFCLYEYHKNN